MTVLHTCRGDQFGDADAPHRGAVEYRHDLVARVLVVQIFAHLIERRLDAFEQFFEQMIVEVAERLEQFSARAGDVGVGTRFDQVDDAGERLAFADRNLFRHDVHAVRRDERVERGGGHRTRAIHLVDKK
jgi:hypothetical protein